MKKTAAQTLIALACSSVHAQQMGMASGQPGSTTFSMMTDVSKVCPAIVVVPSEGSLDNIVRISGDKRVQMGYTQEDAAVYQQGEDPDMMKRIQMMFPLFSAELHLVVAANSPIKTLAELAGKRVYESAAGTGTWVTAQVIKSVTKINWVPVNLAKKEDGLRAIQQGQADAGLFVEGRPIALLENATGIRLIPISNPQLDAYKYEARILYNRALIPSGSYAWQTAAVPTYKVKFALMTYAYKNEHQKEIGDFVTCIVRNIGTLQKNGHSKWKDVDPTEIDKISWPVHPAAMAAIKRELKAGR